MNVQNVNLEKVENRVQTYPKGRAVLNKVDAKTDAQQSLIPKTDLNHVAPREIGASDISSYRVQSRNTFLNNFENMDLKSVTSEELLRLLCIANSFLSQESQETLRETEKTNREALERAVKNALEAIRANSVLMATIEGTKSSVALFEGVNVKGFELSEKQTTAITGALGGSNAYLQSVSRSETTATAAAEKQLEMANNAFKQDVRQAEGDVQKANDLVSTVEQQRMQAVKTATGA